MQALYEAGIPALVADNQMRKRDERLGGQERHRAKGDPLHDKSGVKKKPLGLFGPGDFKVDAATNSAICPAGQSLYSNGSHCKTNGRVGHKYTGTKAGCGNCALRDQCLRHPERTQVRQVTMFATGQGRHAASERMKQAIDSSKGRALYSGRIATVEPVFGNIRFNKAMDRFTLRGQGKVRAQWNLYVMVHDIEKLAHNGYAAKGR